MADGFVVDIPLYECPAHWAVSAKTFLIDRIVPAVEYLYLPPCSVGPGTISGRIIGNGTIPATRTGLKAVLHRQRYRDFGPGAIAGTVVDMRHSSPQNWAHALNFHMPLSQMVRDRIGGPLTIVLPRRTPGYVRRLFDIFDFNYVMTDQAVCGERVCDVTMTSPQMLRSNRRALLAPLIARLQNDRSHFTERRDLPAKVFISRKKGRALTNEAEVAAYLANQGYVKIYPEELSVGEQLVLFNEATHIVGIHSAGLAPLIYRSVDRPLQMIELLAPGHMTNAYRHAVHQAGGAYAGVRGRLDKAMFPAAYRFAEGFAAYSLNDFTVCLESLEAALAISANHGALPHSVTGATQ